MSASASHPKPIVLLPVRARQAPDSDSRPRIPNSIPPGLYENIHGAGASTRTGPVPPLAFFCIRTLLDYADQVHCLGSHRLRSQPDVLRALAPPTFGDPGTSTRCLCKLDPRLWSIIVQVYSDLPKGLQNYYTPLGDRHLPLLQAIPSTPSFALITVLNLVRCVSDETSHALRSLHGLCALDISQTSVSHLGIRHFAPTITNKPSDPRCGTRGLRILRLCDCPKITDQVIAAVSNFPLLAILGSYHSQTCCRVTHTDIDLRGTSCTRDLNPDIFRSSSKSQRHLFQCSLQDALQRLRNSDSGNVLFSHPDPFVIYINTEFHPRWPQRPNIPKPAPDTPARFPEKSRAAASSSAVATHQRYHHHQGSLIVAAEQELRKWISSMLDNAGNETCISKIADFVMQRWKYNPERLQSDGKYGSDSGLLLEEDDSIGSWDGDNSSTLCPHFYGYQVDEGLAEEVWEMVEDAWDEHESATRFYGLDLRASKTLICHCKTLRDTTTSPAETMPTNRYLMLVRDPPRWVSVYGPDAPPLRRVRLATKPSLSDSSNLNPNRSSVPAEHSTQELLGMIIQRKSFPITATSPSLVSTPTISRNPFRKDFSISSARGGLKNLYRGPGDSPQDGNLDPVPDGPTPKRMKSIFQLPIPPRPTPLGATLQSQRAKSSGGPRIAPKKPGKLKQTTLSGVFDKRT